MQNNTEKLIEGGLISHQLPIEKIHHWRSAIFSVIADRITNPHVPMIQKAIAMWPWYSNLSFPKKSDCNMLADGAMRISVALGEDKMLFSIGIWMFLGEVRVGVRLDRRLVSNEGSLRDKISRAYDGNVCHRQVNGENSLFFDWIFRDGFADKDLMAASLNDQDLAAMIADAIYNIVAHFYMSSMNAIIDSGVMLPSVDGSLHNTSSIVRVNLDVESQDAQAFVQIPKSLTELGVVVEGVYPQSELRAFFIVSVQKDRLDSLSLILDNLSMGLGCQACVHSIEGDHRPQGISITGENNLVEKEV